MFRSHDLSSLNWTLAGYTPTSWGVARSMELGIQVLPEISPVPATVPGSVQHALLQAGLLPDWNCGLNYRACEWVENRDWCFATTIPGDWLQQGKTRLRLNGLDSCGVMFLNGQRLMAFHNGFIHYEIDLGNVPVKDENLLEIVFTVPPRWNGTPNFSSQITDWKTRFNYTWDWMPRNVQIGIWDDIYLLVHEGPVLGELETTTSVDADGTQAELRITGHPVAAEDCQVKVRLEYDGHLVREETRTALDLMKGIRWTDLDVKPWQPNGSGEQALYTLTCVLTDSRSETQEDIFQRRLGFRHLRWNSCKGAPKKADPWICVVNGKETFLSGVNWTPIRSNYADVSPVMYRQRLELYRDAGFNLMRVWGGAFLEKSCFYDLCDELGLLVWQEFPLNSSGPDNYPPTDEASLREMELIGKSYVMRRRHHPSLLMWCGGNELQTKPDGTPGCGKPLTDDHPMLALLKRIVEENDPDRRYMATSSSGPSFLAEDDFGKGQHWDVHGPWRMPGDNPALAEAYWKQDDALFRSETGHPGASDVALLKKYHGDLVQGSISLDNPLWRLTPWWLEAKQYQETFGAEPSDLEHYVAWSQYNQTQALTIAARACLSRFPEVGGFLIWMGHDAWPCAANTAIIDFDGNPKPAYHALKAIFAAQSDF